MLRNVLLIFTPLIIITFIIQISSASDVDTDVKNKITPESYSYGAILQYHHVDTSTPAVTSISPELFKQHLDLIQSEGFSVISLDEMIQNIKLGIPFKSKTLAITFDDNYRSIYDHAFPLLKERKWPFTIFVNPKSVRADASSINQAFILSWSQLKEMKDSGAIIANHTQNHWHLLKRNQLDSNQPESKQDWSKRIQNDILSAQITLEQHLGDTPKWLAYPYGEFDENLKKIIHDMGYLAFSQQSGGINQTTDWQSIPRFPASGVYSNLNTLKVKINSEPFQIYSQSPDNKIRLQGDAAPALELVVNKADIIDSQISCYFAGNKIYSETRINGQKITINAQLEGIIPFGRSRYNCTAPSKRGHYFWYSMPFVTTNLSGEWQD